MLTQFVYLFFPTECGLEAPEKDPPTFLSFGAREYPARHLNI